MNKDGVFDKTVEAIKLVKAKGFRVNIKLDPFRQRDVG